MKLHSNRFHYHNHYRSGGSGNKRYFSRSVEVEKKSSSLIAEFCQNVDYEVLLM